MRRKFRVGRSQRVRDLANEFRAENGIPFEDPIDADDFTTWVIERSRLAVPGYDPHRAMKRLLSRALREDYTTDPQNRRVHNNAAVVVKKPDGTQQTLWATDYLDAPVEHMHKSLQQKRQQLVFGALQHKTDADSYNDNNRRGARLPLFSYDLREDLEELEQRTDYPDSKPPTL